MKTPSPEETSIPPPVYPVILCGGAGERLWPMSRPWRPKPFLPLIGPQSSFQAAVLRAAPLTQDGELVVIGGEAHRDLIAAELAAVGVKAQVLLEPTGRDTAAAIAAAATWVATRAPRAILAVLPADHHIPDAAAFAAAIRSTFPAVGEGAIATLGLRPTEGSTSYGYIRPGAGEGAVKPIAAFEEKPDASRAARLVAEGALWNSGIFVAEATTILTEMRTFAGEVATAAEAAVADATSIDGGLLLGPDFLAAPKVAFDRAVMERTARGVVLAVDFSWSDLGAWDAVLAASARDGDGASLPDGASVSGGADVLVRAPAGVQVEVVGVSRLAVVVEPDAVLVASLDDAQAVRRVVARRTGRFASLAEASGFYDVWLRTAALPLWATVGVDTASGAFREALTWDGVPDDPWRRARVQARQAFVFASAAADGLEGPWSAVARTGIDWLRTRGRLSDGLFAAKLDLSGAPGEAAGLYDHAFVLLALAGLARAAPDDRTLEPEALDLLDRLQAFRHAAGFREAEPHPFQANAHMHLFEAALAWEDAGGQAAWTALADELADLALTRFIDPATGVLHEFFDAGWRPLGEAGLIEPGHQFEWAWLLERWGVARGHAAARAAARRLFSVGRRAFDPLRGVAVNALWEDLSVRDAGARLWPQTEHLKAALILGEQAAALEAANGMARYLDTPARGVWRERMRADGGFLTESSPATSLYHLYLAIRELARCAADPC